MSALQHSLEQYFCNENVGYLNSIPSVHIPIIMPTGVNLFPFEFTPFPSLNEQPQFLQFLYLALSPFALSISPIFFPPRISPPTFCFFSYVQCTLNIFFRTFVLFLADVEFLVTGKTSSKKSNHLKTITFLETAIENLKKDL